MAGVTTGTMLAVDVLDGRGQRLELVLKLYRPDPSEPDSAWREAHILNLLTGNSHLPASRGRSGREAARVGPTRSQYPEFQTPKVIGLDREGSETGWPALVMTRLQGRGGTHVMKPRLSELAGLAARIHALPIPEADLPRYRLWGLDDPLPMPSRWSDPGVWRAAVDIFRGRMPDEPGCFIHRDFHPGNVLWKSGRAMAIVDWLHGCWGPASADLAHCRINLWLDVGPSAAQGLLDAYRSINPAMHAYNGYWDIADAMSWHIDPKTDGAQRARRFEAFITAAVATRFSRQGP
jgi:phosphotransferase family enzyme